jgi:hypothetical protein
VVATYLLDICHGNFPKTAVLDSVEKKRYKFFTAKCVVIRTIGIESLVHGSQQFNG